MDFDLETLAHVEQTFFDEGYQDGHAHGRIHGLIEGRALGREKGFEMWEELAFYEGFGVMWRSIYSLHERKDDRILHNLKHLLDLIAQFPRFNPSTTTELSELDIPKLFRQIRSRYKALCATLGVRSTLRSGEQPVVSQDEFEDLGFSPAATAPSGGTVNNVWKIDNTAPLPSDAGLSF